MVVSEPCGKEQTDGDDDEQVGRREPPPDMPSRPSCPHGAAVCLHATTASATFTLYTRHLLPATNRRHDVHPMRRRFR